MVLPFSFLSSALSLSPCSGWWFGLCPEGTSFLGKTESRSSSELLGCGFSLDLPLLRLAAAKMEETRRSRLHWSFPEPQEPCSEKQRSGREEEKNTKMKKVKL